MRTTFAFLYISLLFLLGSYLVGCTSLSTQEITPTASLLPPPSSMPAPAPTKPRNPTMVIPLAPTSTQTALPEPTVTLTNALRELEVYFDHLNGPLRIYHSDIFSLQTSYAFFEQRDNSIIGPTYLDQTTTLSGSGPASAKHFAFSNHSNVMAYWTYGTESQRGQLWLSDMAYQHSLAVFTDTHNTYDDYQTDELFLSWTPDDQHLMIDVARNQTLDMIYHLQTNSMEAWAYDCDRLAISPQSKKVATWCLSTIDRNQYAVIEWGGEIWYSSTPPETELVRRQIPPVRTWYMEKPNIWGWSSDGNLVAYFDPSDPIGYLYIVDADGNLQLKTLPGGAYWFQKQDPAGLPPANLIHWSKDGSRLLIYATGLRTDSCPQWTNIFSEDITVYAVPCWQVIESSNGELIWTLSDSAAEITAPADISFIQNYNFPQASISPNGTYLSLIGSTGSTSQVIIIDLGNNSLIFSSEFFVYAMRWEYAPNR